MKRRIEVYTDGDIAKEIMEEFPRVWGYSYELVVDHTNEAIMPLEKLSNNLIGTKLDPLIRCIEIVLQNIDRLPFKIRMDCGNYYIVVERVTS